MTTPAAAAAPAERGLLDGRTMSALLLAASVNPLGSTMISAALPAMGRDLGSDTVSLTQWVVTSYLLVAVAVQSPAGKLGDALGHKRTFTAGQALCAAGAALGIAAQTVWMVVLARVLGAAGGGLVVASVMAMLNTGVAPERRGRAFGAFGATMALAAAIGPVVGGGITARASWRGLFAVWALPLVASVALWRPRAHVSSAAPRPSRGALDLPGIVLLAGSVAALVAAPRLGTRAVAAGAMGVTGLVAFVLWERRARDPLLPLELLRRRAFVAGAGVVALQNLALYALLFELPAYFADARGVGGDRTGRAEVGMMLSMVVMSAAGGRLAERLGPRIVTTGGALVATLALVWMRGLARFTTPAELVLPLALFGAGIGLSTAPAQAAALGAVDAGRSGVAAGHLSTLRYLGGVAGIAALGALVGGQKGTAALAGHDRAIQVFTGVLAVAACLGLLLPSSLETPA